MILVLEHKSKRKSRANPKLGLNTHLSFEILDYFLSDYQAKTNSMLIHLLILL